MYFTMIFLVFYVIFPNQVNLDCFLLKWQNFLLYVTMKSNGIDETAPAYFQLNIFHKEAGEGKSEIALCAKILKKPIISGIFHMIIVCITQISWP